MEESKKEERRMSKGLGGRNKKVNLEQTNRKFLHSKPKEYRKTCEFKKRKIMQRNWTRRVKLGYSHYLDISLDIMNYYVVYYSRPFM